MLINRKIKREVKIAVFKLTNIVLNTWTKLIKTVRIKYIGLPQRKAYGIEIKHKNFKYRGYGSSQQLADTTSRDTKKHNLVQSNLVYKLTCK